MKELPLAKNILLMTATVVPPAGVPNLSHTDPEARSKDYEKAIEWYSALVPGTFSRIVFVDNSNSDLTRFLSAVHPSAKGLVEFLAFPGLDHPPAYDRAYGEFKLLDHAMTHSSTILSADPAKDRIWKVTGRYIVRNVEELVATAPSEFELYGNCRNWPKRWIDTYMLAWTRDGYEALVRDVYHRLKTNVPGIPVGLSGEELFRSWLDQPLFRRRRIVRRFRTTALLEGIRGADGRNYSNDDGWKTRVRGAVRRIAPFVWI